MDHRWDDRVRQDREARFERDRYGTPRVERDPSVERRDALARARRVPDYSPWSIGEAHWDQRDLYTRDARTDDAGYGRGPAIHPEVGSYAYHRDEPPPPSRRGGADAGEPSLYEREAWPWLNYHGSGSQGAPQPLWQRMKDRLSRVAGRHTGHGPKNWARSDERIREDVCEVLEHHGDLDARDIEVEVATREVTLRGSVPDRRSKRLAEELAERCTGVEDVHNRLRIQPHDDPSDTDVAFVMPVRSFA
jgi:hypothetical protein